MVCNKLKLKAGKKEEKLKKFMLEIPEEIWNKQKDKIPRSISFKDLTKLIFLESFICSY